jgi:hypothetical protein
MMVDHMDDGLTVSMVTNNTILEIVAINRHIFCPLGR